MLNFFLLMLVTLLLLLLLEAVLACFVIIREKYTVHETMQMLSHFISTCQWALGGDGEDLCMCNEMPKSAMHIHKIQDFLSHAWKIIHKRLASWMCMKIIYLVIYSARASAVHDSHKHNFPHAWEGINRHSLCSHGVMSSYIHQQQTLFFKWQWWLGHLTQRQDSEVHIWENWHSSIPTHILDPQQSLVFKCCTPDLK